MQQFHYILSSSELHKSLFYFVRRRVDWLSTFRLVWTLKVVPAVFTCLAVAHCFEVLQLDVGAAEYGVHVWLLRCVAIVVSEFYFPVYQTFRVDLPTEGC